MNPPSPNAPAALLAMRRVRCAQPQCHLRRRVLRCKGRVQRLLRGAPVPLWRLLTAVAGALQAIRGGQSGTTALVAVDAGRCAPACRPCCSRSCARPGGPRPCADSWPPAPPHPPPMPCCAARWRCAGTHRPRPTNPHPGEPGGGGGQAPPGHARAGLVHQRLPAPLSARARFLVATDNDPWRAGTIRPGGCSACARTTPALGADPAGQQCPRTHGAAGQ